MRSGFSGLSTTTLVQTTQQPSRWNVSPGKYSEMGHLLSVPHRPLTSCFGTTIRLVRCLLGKSSIADRKCECGNPLTILGVLVCIDRDGVRFLPDYDKTAKWCDQIKAALADNRLCAGEASKLAGE